jgi:hypothetical protein
LCNISSTIFKIGIFPGNPVLRIRGIFRGVRIFRPRKSEIRSEIVLYIGG